MKLETKADVWLYLAEAFTKSEDRRTKSGICLALRYLHHDRIILSPLCSSLLTAVTEDVRCYQEVSAYFCATNQRNRVLRADYLYLLYCMEVDNA